MADGQQDRTTELVEKARKGDRAAFSRLVKEHLNPVLALTYRMTGDREASHDLAQESFIAAWKNLASFRGDSKFSSWMYRIAMNRTLNYLEREQPESLDQLAEGSWAVDTREQPDRGLERQELERQIVGFMHGLPMQQRSVFELRFYQHMTFEEIAGQMNRSVPTVKTHYREAVEKLRRFAIEKGIRP